MSQSENELANILQEINKRLDRMEQNQGTMIGTLNGFSDAYKEQQVQLRDHERRIDKLERGGPDYFMDVRLH